MRSQGEYCTGLETIPIQYGKEKLHEYKQFAGLSQRQLTAKLAKFDDLRGSQGFRAFGLNQLSIKMCPDFQGAFPLEVAFPP